MSKFTKHFSMTMVAVLFLGMFYILTPHAYAATSIAIINPLDGTNSFAFTTAELPVGGTFAINLTVIDAVDLATWQARVDWDPALLEFVSFVFPSDDVFFNKSPIRAPTDSSVPGTMLAGAVAGPGAGSFTGTGTLGVLTLKIIDGEGTSEIKYTNFGSDTFLLDINGNDIAFTPIDGVYTLTKVAAGLPSFKLQPSTIKPLAKGDIFTVDVMVSGVDPSAEIIGFQFSIMWDTSLIAPAAPFFANGSFLEAFQYNGDGVLYATDINAHNRPPPVHQIADGWNYSTVGEILMPDSLANSTYHAPFPSGSGRLGTFYFKALTDTVAPTQITSTIDFIPEDFLVLTASGENIGYKTATGAVYYVPMKSLGLAIDLYTQYPAPFGGQGGNMTSDSFGPQQEINLCAKLTYNDFGVPGKLVAFEITHKSNNSDVTFHFAREATTDANGTACITFKIPWNGPDSAGDVFGWWYVNATGDVGGQTTIDNLRFYVWWPVEVTSIEPKFSSATQRVGGGGDPMNFTLSARTYHIQPIVDVLFTGTIHDELQFFIGSADTTTTMSAPDYTGLPWTELPPPEGTFDWNFTVPLSPNAVVGKGTAFGNAFNTWPWNGGFAYCPEVTNTQDFFISKPT